LKLWIDGDACPRAVRRIVFRAAERLEIEAHLVANSDVAVPRSPWIRATRVPSGLDVADRHLVRESRAGDVVITADVPLAAELVRKEVTAISPRGELYDAETIGERLAMRDLMEQLRETGVVSGGPSVYGEPERRRFADALDRLLTGRIREQRRPRKGP
jgi:uncharacterized protein YaiI (UPF0178 family)